MPVLPISDGEGGLLPFAPTFLLARMLYPRDEPGHVQYLGWSILALAADTSEPEDAAVPQCVVVPQFALQAAVAAPSHCDVIEAGLSQAQGAHAAGEILRFIAKCRIHHPEHPPSVSKTWDILSRTWAGGSTRDGRPLHSSISFLKAAWKTFKPVAHLWAAATAVTVVPDPSGAPPLEFDPGRLEGLPAFLALAEAFRKLGESITVQGQKLPVLDPAESWATPPDLALPQIEIELPRLPQETLAFLAVRKAPVRAP